MWDFLRENGFIMSALAGGLAGAIFTFLVDYLRRQKKRLLFIVNSRKVIERNYPEIDVHYEGEAVQRIYSHEVIVRNEGIQRLKAILIKIKCNSGKFIELLTKPVTIMSHSAGTKYKLEDDGKTVVVKFDVLMPNEALKISLIAVDSVDSQIVVEAQGEDLGLRYKQITRDEQVHNLKRVAMAISLLVLLIFVTVLTYFTLRLIGENLKVDGLSVGIVLIAIAVGLIIYQLWKFRNPVSY